MVVEMDIKTYQYFELERILKLALEQASEGKGSERHANGEDFEKQKICEISRRLGSNDYNLGQAVKKIYESKRLPKERAIAELLGAINYSIRMDFEGRLAEDRIKLEREMQRSFVDACNLYNLNIPFPQMTIHMEQGL